MSVMKEEKSIILNNLRETFREVIASSMGSSVCDAIEFYLRKYLGKDPFEVFWDDPPKFFGALQKVFGAGAEVFIKMLILGVNRKYGLRYDAETFLKLLNSKNEKSLMKFHDILKKIFGPRNPSDEGKEGEG